MKFGLVFISSLALINSLSAENFREKIKNKLRDRVQEKLNAQPAPQISELSEHISTSGMYIQSIEIQQKKRYYKIYIPNQFDKKKTYPILFSIHGGAGDMDTQSNNDYYNQLTSADKNDYIVIFPNGYSQFPSGKLATWNAGKCCGKARDLNIDDIGFFKAMIEKTKQQVKINPEKIFASGMSNGAMMSYRLACEMSDIFTGIASVAGTDNTSVCNPQKPISIFHTHAKDDDHVNFNGGVGTGAVAKEMVTEFKSVSETIKKWITLNNCQPMAKKTSEGIGYSCERYESCRNNVVVQLCVTETGGHSWPGGKSPRMLKNKSNFQGFSATEKNWEFFSSLKKN